MSGPKLAVTLDPGPFHPGDTVRGSISLVEGGKSRALTAQLLFTEHSPDYNHQVREEAIVTLHQGALSAGMGFEFNLPLPPDARPSIEAGMGRLAWSVSIRSDERGFDTFASESITVVSSEPPPTEMEPVTAPPPPAPERTNPIPGILLVLAILAGSVVAGWSGMQHMSDISPIFLPSDEEFAPTFDAEFSGHSWFGRVKGIETYEDSLTLRTDLRLDKEKDLETVRTMCTDVRGFLDSGNYSSSSIYIHGKTASDYGYCESF